MIKKLFLVPFTLIVVVALTAYASDDEVDVVRDGDGVRCVDSAEEAAATSTEQALSKCDLLCGGVGARVCLPLKGMGAIACGVASSIACGEVPRAGRYTESRGRTGPERGASSKAESSTCQAAPIRICNG